MAVNVRQLNMPNLRFCVSNNDALTMSRPENLQVRISLRFVYEWCVRGPRDQIRESEANVGVPFQEGLGYPDVGVPRRWGYNWQTTR